MRTHDIVSGLKIKYMAKQAGLTHNEMEIVLTVRFSGALVTPTLSRLLGVPRSVMNTKVGPRLVQQGWLRHSPATHRTRDVLPSKRWTIPEARLETLRQLENEAQQMLNDTMTESFVQDLDWISLEENVECPA